MKNTLTLLVWSLMAAGASAQMSPVGTWHSIDDKTKELKSELVLSESNGVISGRISMAPQPVPKPRIHKDSARAQLNRSSTILL